jgi:ATP-dependent Lon protease
MISASIPGPLRDRMEIINIAGYTPHEKLQIAKKYLLKRKQWISHGLKEYPVGVADKVLMKMIRSYTKEAGVRDLERHMNTIARKIATDVVTNDVEKGKKYNVTAKQLEKYLGPEKFEEKQLNQTRGWSCKWSCLDKCWWRNP